MNSFQERLQELLTDNNLSRLQLSKIIGVTSTTINGYFNDDYYPQIDIAIKIVKYFNCSLDYLFGFSDKFNNNNANHNSFIENFTYVLKDRKFSIASGLRGMGMSEANYYRWKKGLFPKTNNLLEIARFFDVSLDFIVGDLLYNIN